MATIAGRAVERTWHLHSSEGTILKYIDNDIANGSEGCGRRNWKRQ